MLTFVFSLLIAVRPAAAAPLCGEGSAPDYGFTNNLQQPHWIVNGTSYTSKQTVAKIDTILDKLNNDSIAQTMILIKPAAEVGNRVNCAVHFLRYMKLGLPTGERKDNGFVFLVVVESNSIDVHYGVGLGLPALTAPELTAINRAAEDTYQSTHSIDQALLTIVQQFDQVARNNYTPLASQTNAPLEDAPSWLKGLVSSGVFLFLCVLFLMIAMWGLRGSFGSGFGRGGGFGSNPWRGGGGFGRGGSWRGGSGGFGGRGGSGSGRAGRGN